MFDVLQKVLSGEGFKEKHVSILSFWKGFFPSWFRRKFDDLNQACSDPMCSSTCTLSGGPYVTCINDCLLYRVALFFGKPFLKLHVASLLTWCWLHCFVVIDSCRVLVSLKVRSLWKLFIVARLISHFQQGDFMSSMIHKKKLIYCYIVQVLRKNIWKG